MKGLIQNTLAGRDLALVHPEKTAVVDFQLYHGETDNNKLAKFYSELGKESADEVPVFRATVGTGGSTSFTIHTGDEEMNLTSPLICGVVIYAHDLNVFFDESLPGEPPVCSSTDGITGHNRLTDETCDCANCPRNKPNKSGGRKECRNKVRLYILTEGIAEPLILDLPPTSMKAWTRQYKKVLNMHGFLKYHEVLTEFTLDSTKNANNIKYSKVKIKMLGKLSPEVAEKVEWIRKLFKPAETIEVFDFADVVEE